LIGKWIGQKSLPGQVLSVKIAASDAGATDVQFTRVSYGNWL
jgi:hypothetical protein